MSAPLRVLLTTTSFQDTPGRHHELLAAAGFELVRERGPLPESRMLDLAGQFDAVICGDDAFTRAVLTRFRPRLRALSKYGIGLDKIDVPAATELGLPVFFTPGVNHTTVAEHTFALLLGIVRHLVAEANHVARGEWKRLTGHEIHGKTLGIVGLGRIGKEVAVRARAFGLRVLAFDIYWDAAFAAAQGVERVGSVAELLPQVDILSLHTALTEQTRHLLDADALARLRPGAIVLNCARGELVDRDAMAAALKSGHLLGYGADVLDEEPPPAGHPLVGLPNALITPHIGSRTHESVQRQATCAVENLTRFLAGRKPVAAANDVPALRTLVD